MVSRHRITSNGDRYFAPAWELYLAAFPQMERRSLELHKEALSFEKFHADAIVDGGEFIGLLFWWDFGSMRYIEHLATDPKLRGGGYGAKIMQQFMNEYSSPVILEVERPEDEIKQRRIGFYERLGFALNMHNYSQPSYNAKSDERLPLLLMSYPKPIQKEDVAAFCNERHPEIFFNREF
ncbi:MAG: GNAT family N-acetyltransferase [Rikenellaceae bacterium]